MVNKQRQPRKLAPEGFLSARDAAKELGIPVSSFHKLVQRGEIKRVDLPWREKEGAYSEIEVQRYARAMRAHIEQFTKDKTYFSPALADDIPDIIALVESTGSLSIPQPVLNGWLRKNPRSIHVLLRGAEIVGYISMLPLPLETILRRMKGEIWNRDIPLDDIQPFTPNTHIRLYIAEADVKQDKPSVTTKLGAQLIREAMRFVLSLSEQGIVIDEIYAVATSPFGIRSCQSLGMEPMDLPEGTRENRIPFRADVAKASSKLIAEYRKKIEAVV